MTDVDPTPEDLEQLARSVAMSDALGDRDRLDVVVALRRLAEIDRQGDAPAHKAGAGNRVEPAELRTVFQWRLRTRLTQQSSR